MTFPGSRQSSGVVCECPGPAKHRLGGVLRYGDEVLVHHYNGTTEHGVVRGSFQPEMTEVRLNDGCQLTIATERLWLVSP